MNTKRTTGVRILAQIGNSLFTTNVLVCPILLLFMGKREQLLKGSLKFNVAPNCGRFWCCNTVPYQGLGLMYSGNFVSLLDAA